MTEKELIEYFNFKDLIERDPATEPYVTLVEHMTVNPTESGIGLYNEFIGYRSYMVSVDLKERAFAEIDYSDITSSGNGCFDEDESGERKYIPGESWEHPYSSDALIVEPLYVERNWPGLDMSCIEPCQRIIRYLNLKKAGENWIDPYTNVPVIRMIEEKKQIKGGICTTRKLEIKIDYLKDYLAARGSGLYIVRYASREFLFNAEDEVPVEPEEKEIKNEGLWRFIVETNSTILAILSENAKGKVYARAELGQKFWIKPLSEPRRPDAAPPSQFKGGVSFTLQDGTKKEFNVEAGHCGDYLTIISFKSCIMEVFTKRNNFNYKDCSGETRRLKFSTGENLDVAINPSGQIQVLWGELAKLDKNMQELLSPYSAAMLEKLSEDHEYTLTHIKNYWPETKSLKQNLMEYKTEINEYFYSRFGETFFKRDSTVDDLRSVHEPYEENSDQLCDIMMELDKWLLSEKRPGTIIEKYKLVDQIDDKSKIDKIKSLISLKLLLKKFFGNNEAESKTKILKIIKGLRNCKGHTKDLSKTLGELNLENKTPGEIYKEVMLELEGFLKWLCDLCRKDHFRV